MEGKLSKESRLDLLRKQASREAALELSKRPEIAKLGAREGELESAALNTIDSIIKAMRENIRSSSGMIASQRKELTGIYEEYPNTEEARRRIDVILERNRGELDASIKHIITSVLKSVGLSENTVRGLVEEIFIQENKIYPFPKNKK